MMQALTTIPPIRRSGNEEDEQQFENILLQSEFESFTRLTTRLNSCRSLFPAVCAPSVTALLALQEVVSLARNGAPMWTSNERLNLNEYYSKCFPWYAKGVPKFVHEASKASALISVDALWLVTNLMEDANYQKIFPSIIGDLSTQSSDPKFSMISVDFMPKISPFTRTRDVTLIRCSRHIENDTWAIADISVYFSSYAQHLRPEFMRLPSGFLIQHITNGVSKVTVLDHWVYKDENVITPYSTFALKWLNALQKHYYNTFLISIPSMGNHIQMFDPIFQTNLLKLSSILVFKFCTGVCGTTGQKWELLGLFGYPVNNTIMYTQEIRDNSGSPSCLVSVTGVAIMQAKMEVIFGLINRTRKHDIWDYFRIVPELKEIIRIKRGPNPGNELIVFSVERNGQLGPREWCLIQETYYDSSEVIIVHGWLEASSLSTVINGGDFSNIDITLDGITIMPYEQQGCILSVGYQLVTGQTMVTRSNEPVVNSLQTLVIDTLRNVQNALSMSTNLR